ncbi:MAG: ATP-binding protein, partial [Desulfobacterales bacterium]
LGRSLKLSVTQREDFEVIEQEIRHIDTIIQNFLEFSRSPRFEAQFISPSVIVDRVIALLAHRLKAHDVRVETVRRQRLPIIEADPERLKEALVNLMVNACEAMASGGRIRISEETIEDDVTDRAVVIRIEDNGPGIPTDLQDKIFQPFFTTKEAGTGLGLSIVQRIIHDHQGRIAVSATPGRGTQFTLTFPAKA